MGASSCSSSDEIEIEGDRDGRAEPIAVVAGGIAALHGRTEANDLCAGFRMVKRGAAEHVAGLTCEHEMIGQAVALRHKDVNEDVARRQPGLVAREADTAERRLRLDYLDIDPWPPAPAAR